MQRLASILITFLLKAVSLLPFCLLYRLADLTYLLLYYVVRYRRNLVERNISSSFPEMSPKQVKSTVRKFYRNFADYFFETVKLAHISDAKMCRHMVFRNVEAIERHLQAGRSVVLYFSHCGNWEWGTSISLWSNAVANSAVGQVYRPLKSRWADEFMLAIRSRFNTRSYPKATVFRDLLRDRMAHRQFVVGFMSDQKPSHGDRVHIVKFLNHPTAVITGTEMAARRLGAAIGYMDITKLRRGYYEITIREIADNVADTDEYAVTDRYIQMLEETIRRRPDIWLWSHNRWKHKVEMPCQQ